jgi:hypothetical protein
LTKFGRAALGAGDAWFDTINTRLAECSLLLTLCTPESVYQPWINFEAGWAWGLEKPVVPVCHGGLMPDDLKMPFSSRQAVTLTRPDDLESLYNAVADVRGSDRPRVAFDEIAREVPDASPPDNANTSLDRLKLDQERVIRRRIRSALEDDQPWRTPLRVANAAGVSEEVALMFLRADDDVRLGSGRDGKQLVGLKRRVAP